MNILYNLRDQSPHTTKSLGILKVSTGLLQGFAEVLKPSDSVTILGNREIAQWLPSLPDNFHLEGRNLPAPTGWARIAWDQFGLWKRAKHSPRAEWLFLPKGYTPLFLRPESPCVAYVHDTLMEDYYRHKEKCPGGRLQRFYFSQALRKTLTTADLLLTNSAFTARCLEQRPHRAPIVVCGIGFSPPPRSDDAPASRRPDNRAHTPNDILSILLPVSPFPHKLSAQAIEWIQMWVRERAEETIVTVLGHLPKGLRWPPERSWLHRSRVSEQELDHLLRTHRILVQFSAFEGFGMLPREAIFRGTSAIASDIPALREALPPPFLFSNNHYPQFASCLNRALQAPLPHIPLDTWPTVARRALQAMQQVRPEP